MPAYQSTDPAEMENEDLQAENEELRSALGDAKAEAERWHAAHDQRVEDIAWWASKWGVADAEAAVNWGMYTNARLERRELMAEAAALRDALEPVANLDIECEYQSMGALLTELTEIRAVAGRVLGRESTT